jgi:hypothetical protein
MYARCKEEECEEYATQGTEVIFCTRLRNICRKDMYLLIRQYIIDIKAFYLSEYGASLVYKEGEPSWYSPPSTQFTRLVTSTAQR